MADRARFWTRWLRHECKRAPGVFLLGTLLLGCTPQTLPPAPAVSEVSTAEYVNGRWWNGNSFEERTVYVIEESFVDRRPSRVDREVDLDGAWVVPPFAEAHNHNFDAPWMLESLNEQLLREGVFYGMSLTNWAAAKQQVLPYWAGTETVDVAFADLALTAAYGHPILIYENLARNQINDDPTSVEIFQERQAEGRAYLLFDSLADVEALWPQVVASRPDILKIFLLTTERWEELARDTTQIGHRGLAPDIASAIVDRAHSEGFRVAAHVETAYDFRLAIEMGVDVIAHLPGYALRHDAGRDTSPYRIDEADARRAANQGVVVIPTPLTPLTDVAVPDHIRAFFVEQLRQLRDSGVRLAIGSDHYSGTPLAEVLFLHELGVFSNAELLEIWGRHSAEVIFPERNIGRLQPGYEASFLALDCSPLEELSCIRNIHMRVKEGRELAP